MWRLSNVALHLSASIREERDGVLATLISGSCYLYSKPAVCLPSGTHANEEELSLSRRTLASVP